MGVYTIYPRHEHPTDWNPSVVQQYVQVASLSLVLG